MNKEHRSHTITARDIAIETLKKFKAIEEKLIAKGKLFTYTYKNSIITSTFKEEDSPLLKYVTNGNIMIDGETNR